MKISACRAPKNPKSERKCKMTGSRMVTAAVAREGYARCRPNGQRREHMAPNVSLLELTSEARIVFPLRFVVALHIRHYQTGRTAQLN